MKRKKYSGLLTLALIPILTASGCGSKSTTAVVENVTSEPPTIPVVIEPVTEEPTTPEPTTEYVEPVTISLIAVGDMLMHAGASIPAIQPDGTYNYDYLFANVRDSIEAADIAVVNNEVIMAGNEIGNIGYPEFNVRTELGDAEVANGFDVILGASNHSMDQMATGVINCVNYWNTVHGDITLLGIHNSEEDANEISIIERNGIKVALLNYTYGLNGFDLPEGYGFAVDLMNAYTRDKIASDIARAKEMSDFVIVFPHWGTEYNLGIDTMQSEWAQFFADQKVDLVIGTHPHVVEPVSYVYGAEGNKTIIYYSLGNFVSVQYYNYSMLGGMAKVNITKDSSGTYVSDYGMDFLVTHYIAERAAITTYYLDSYTDELAAEHAILVEPGEKYMEVNQWYPFTVAGLKALAKSICPELTPNY